MKIDCRGRELDLSSPCVMGVLNVTPDSFSDGGEWTDSGRAVSHARRMMDEGASIIDIGGESTRPGAEPVSVAEELSRVLPVIESLRDLPVILSIDTSKPEVMRAAIDAGAHMVNDVNALRAPDAIETVASLEVPVVLMHMQGEPRTMQKHPHYDDVVAEVRAFLAERLRACETAGIPRQRVLVDPGFGFGKTVEHNLELLARLDELVEDGQPVLAGLSRKSMLAAILNREVDQRLAGSLSVATLAAWQGASILRVHDVAETVDAVKMVAATRAARTGA